MTTAIIKPTVTTPAPKLTVAAPKQLTTTPAALACVKGSLQQVAVATGKPLAKIILGVSAVVMIDTSWSMTTPDSEGNQSRYFVACRELARLQMEMAGKIAVVSFDSEVKFCPTGQPAEPGGSTDLTAALEFCKKFDVGAIKFVVISDGDPDDRMTALQVAKTYRNPISCVFVGPTSGAGRQFLNELATNSNGQALEANQARGLLPAMQRLLTVQAR